MNLALLGFEDVGFGASAVQSAAPVSHVMALWFFAMDGLCVLCVKKSCAPKRRVREAPRRARVGPQSSRNTMAHWRPALSPSRR